MTGPDPTPAVPTDGPTDPVRVWAWINPEAATDPPAVLVDVVAATNLLVRRWVTAPPAGTGWREDTVVGATMLAARVYRRRATPTGVDTTSLESAVYVRRNDPDIALLLQIGSYAPPVVG